MDFQIGTKLVDSNGESIGHLSHVIVDQASSQVLELVIGEGGLFGRDVVLPITAVTSADESEIAVDLNPEQLHALPPFEITNYVAPPIGSYNHSAGFLIAPGVIPVGAAAGMETIAMTPTVDVIEQLPEGAIDLEPSTEVWARDGKIGTVKSVSVAPDTNRVTSLTVESGFLLHTDLEIPIDQVANLGTDRVTLKISTDEIDHSDSG